MASYHFKTKPWPHQVKAFKFGYRHLRDYGNVAFQVPMRYGKTKLSIDLMSALALQYGISRVLVVTTPSGLGVWHEEVPLHCPLPSVTLDEYGVRFNSGLGTEAYRELKSLSFLVTHHVNLFEHDMGWDPDNPRAWTPVPSLVIERFQPEAIIVDESHKIGAAKSEISKMAYRYGRDVKFRVNLTGTKFHRGPLMVFGQFRFLDPSVFGDVEAAFKREYIKFGGFGNYEIVGYRNLDKLAQKVKSRTFIAEKLPPKQPPIVSQTPVVMEECKPYMKEMVAEAGIVVNGKAVLAPIVLTKHLRCSMIAGGWAKNEDGGYHRVGEEKYRALADMLTLYWEEGIERVVIGARFTPELRDIARAAKKAGYAREAIHGGIPAGPARTARVEAFRVAKQPTVMVCQVAAAAEAVDMSTAAHMIFYSIPESYVTYDQFKSRIEKYKDPRTLSYEHLVMKGSRDEVTMDAMMHKQDVATYLMSDPARVQRISEREDAFYRSA